MHSELADPRPAHSMLHRTACNPGSRRRWPKWLHLQLCKAPPLVMSPPPSCEPRPLCLPHPGLHFRRRPLEFTPPDARGPALRLPRACFRGGAWGLWVLLKGPSRSGRTSYFSALSVTPQGVSARPSRSLESASQGTVLAAESWHREPEAPPTLGCSPLLYKERCILAGCSTQVQEILCAG